MRTWRERTKAKENLRRILPTEIIIDAIQEILYQLRENKNVLPEVCTRILMGMHGIMKRNGASLCFHETSDFYCSGMQINDGFHHP